MDKPRGEHHGAFHHIYNHAVDEIDLFLSDADRELLFATLAKSVARYGIIIHAIVLMSNHVHILIETPTPDMGAFMQHFKSCFTKAFNRIHGRKGALFREKYKNEPIESEEQLKEVLRYIHNNPVKAGIVSRPEDFKWSSMSAYLGRTERPRWLTVDRLLDLLQGCENLQRFTANLSPKTAWDPDEPRRTRYSESFIAKYLQRPPRPT